MNPTLPVLVTSAHATLIVALFRLLFHLLLLGPLLAVHIGLRLGWASGAFGAAVFPAMILTSSYMDVFGVSQWGVWNFIYTPGPGDDHNIFGFSYLMFCASACVLAMASGISNSADARLAMRAGDERAQRFCRKQNDAILLWYVASVFFGIAFMFVEPFRDLVVFMVRIVGPIVSFVMNVVFWPFEVMFSVLVWILVSVLPPEFVERFSIHILSYFQS